MRRRDLVGALSSMGQAVDKQKPTRLELTGHVVRLPCDMGRLRLYFFSVFLMLSVMGDGMVAHVRFRQAVGGRNGRAAYFPVGHLWLAKPFSIEDMRHILEATWLSNACIGVMCNRVLRLDSPDPKVTNPGVII